MNIKLLVTALSVMSTLAACNNAPEKVLASLVIADTGHDLDGKTVTEDEPSIPPKAAEPSSSEYVPPVTEACSPGDFQFRVWSCDSTGHRAYI